MAQFRISKGPMTMIAIASACARFAKVGNLVSGVTDYQCIHGTHCVNFILSGRVDSGWEFSLVVWAPGTNWEIFNFDPPVFEQRVRVKFSPSLFPPSARTADWTGTELWVEYDLERGIVVRQDQVEEIKIICPEKAELVVYATSQDRGTAPEFAKIRSHIPTCVTCRDLVDEMEADPNDTRWLKP